MAAPRGLSWFPFCELAPCQRRLAGSRVRASAGLETHLFSDARARVAPCRPGSRGRGRRTREHRREEMSEAAGKGKKKEKKEKEIYFCTNVILSLTDTWTRGRAGAGLRGSRPARAAHGGGRPHHANRGEARNYM